MFCRETILRPMNMSVFHQTAMFIRPRTTLLILMSTILRLQDCLLGLSRTNANVLQGNHTQAYEYERVSSNRHVHKTKNYSAYSYEYYSPPTRLFARAPKPKFSDAALRLIASKPPLKMWVAKKA